MKIGIKYCGGCNYRYDRVGFVQKLKNEFEKTIEFENVHEEGKYDALLVISGCKSNCPDYVSYTVGLGVIFVTEEVSFAHIVLKLKKMISEGLFDGMERDIQK